jgi:hypothetical protein
MGNMELFGESTKPKYREINWPKPRPEVIQISKVHYDACVQLARRVHRENVSKHRRATNDCPDDNLGDRIESYGAECALGLYLKIPWEADDWFREKPDVGPNQVRSTAPNLRVWVTKKDRDEDPYVLVWVRGNRVYEVRGWAWGHEIRQRGREIRSRKNPSREPAVYLDHQHLHSPQTIPTE